MTLRPLVNGLSGIVIELPDISSPVLNENVLGSSILTVGVPVYPLPPSAKSILLITPYCSRTADASAFVVPCGVNVIVGGVV